MNGNSSVSATVPVNVGEFCLTGSWRINHQEFARLMSQGGAAVTPAGGTWDLTVSSDGSFVSTLSDFAFSMTVEGSTITIRVNGSQTGSVMYTATDIVGVTTDSMSLAVTAETPFGSRSMTSDDLPLGTEIGGGPYRCEDGQLIVNRDGMDILYDKIS